MREKELRGGQERDRRYIPRMLLRWVVGYSTLSQLVAEKWMKKSCSLRIEEEDRMLGLRHVGRRRGVLA